MLQYEDREIFHWLRENGCPMSSRTVREAMSDETLISDEEVCEFAARCGRLETLQWVRANGCPWDKTMCACEVDKRHRDMFDWAHEKGCKMSD